IIMNLLKTGMITSSFGRKSRGKVTYSHRQHTKTETNFQPFETVNDRGFQSLMKTGCPEYYLPSPSTVSHDMKLVFANVQQQLTQMLQDHDSELNFRTDAWTPPNHKAFVAVSVHLKHEGQPLAMVLDVVEVPQSHSGTNLAEAF
ncbi:hypothetical protein BDR05DRAFT_835910, partial [Suillus weaverae]